MYLYEYTQISTYTVYFFVMQVVDVESLILICTYTPHCKDIDDEILSEPPLTRMFTSPDGQWLAAVNCFGDIYIFNLEIGRY